VRKFGVWVAVGALACGLALVAPGVASAAPVATSADKMWQTDGRVDAMAYSPDGSTLYLAGIFRHLCPAGQNTCTGTEAGDVAIDYLAALNATTGAPITTWRPEPDGETSSIAVAASGQVYVGGVFNKIGTQVHHKLAALTAATGAPIATWVPNVSAQVKSIALSPDASIVYVGGNFLTVNLVTRSRLAALSAYSATATAATLLPWDPEPTGSTTIDKGVPVPTTINSVAVRSTDGQVYAGGVFTTIGGLTRNNVAAVGSAAGGGVGAAVPGFSMNPVLSYVDLNVSLTRDGSTLFANGRGPGGFVRGIDSSSGQQLWARHFDGDVQASVATDTLIYVGGHFDNVSIAGTSLLDVRHHAAALDTATGATDPWNPTENSAFGVYAMAWAPGHVGIGGDFTKIQNLAHEGVGQFSGTDAVAPAAVTDLTAASTSKGRVDLSWSASADSDTPTLTYRVYRRLVGGTFALLGTVSGPNSATATGPVTYADLTGTIGTAYEYAVRVADPVYLSAYSNVAGVTVLGDQFAPGTPTGVSATSPSAGNALVTWTGGGDADDSTVTYTVTRASGTTNTVAGTVVGASSGPQTFHDTSAAGGTFTYTVRASDGTLSSAASAASPALVVAADPSKPTVPTGLTATSTVTNTVTLTWKPSTDSQQSAAQLVYQVSRKLKTASGTGAVIATTAPGQTTFTDTSDATETGGPALPGKAYTYYVAANDGPNTSVKSGGVSATVDSSVFTDPMTSLAAWTLPAAAGAVSLNTTSGHTAAPSAQLNATASPKTYGYATRTLPAAYRTVCMLEWVSVTAYDTTTNGQTTLLRLFSSTGNDVARMYIDGKGLLWVRSDWASSANITTVTVPADGSWHSFELCVTTTANGASGSMTGYYGGKSLGTVTGVDNSTDPLGAVDMGERSGLSTFNIAIDDVSVGTSPR
jgi:hypothetical protein